MLERRCVWHQIISCLQVLSVCGIALLLSSCLEKRESMVRAVAGVVKAPLAPSAAPTQGADELKITFVNTTDAASAGDSSHPIMVHSSFSVTGTCRSSISSQVFLYGINPYKQVSCLSSNTFVANISGESLGIKSIFAQQSGSLNSSQVWIHVKSSGGIPTPTPTPTATATAVPIPSNRIDLTNVLILNEVGEGTAQNLIDEQSLVGDPATNHGGVNFSTEHHYNWRADLVYSHRYLNVIVDLRKEYKVKEIYLFGGNNQIEMQIGGPLTQNWSTVGSAQLVMNQWNKIVSNQPNASTRHLRIKLKTFGLNDYPKRGNFGKELALYGSPANSSLPEPIPAPQYLIPSPYMEDFIGTNSFLDAPVNDRYILSNSTSSQNPGVVPGGGGEVFPVVRSYSMHQWFEGNYLEGQDLAAYPGNAIEFEMGNGWNYDYYLFYLNTESSQKTDLPFKVYSDIVYTPMHLLQPAIKSKVGLPIKSFDWNFGESKPIEAGSTTLLFSDNPAHFKSSAKFYFNLAARYGSNLNVSNSLVKIRSNQNMKKGLSYLKTVELMNEPDAWWHLYKPAIDVDHDGQSDTGLLFYWHPYEYAAYLSAGYDGDEGRLGGGHGVKTADANMQVSHAGLAFAQMDYPLLVQMWSEQKRSDKKAPFDILNFHYYSNSNGFQGGSNQVGVTPEEDHMYEKMKKLVDLRNRFFPRKPLWITEFGYDAGREGMNVSPQGVPVIPGFSREETQGTWLIRSYLALAAAGVDQACQYMLRDTIPEGPNGDPYASGLYATSGVIGNYPEYTPKAAYYYIGAFVNAVKGTKFHSIVDGVDYQNLNSDIAIYKFFGNKQGNKTVYAVWIPGALGSNNIKSNVIIPTGFSAKSMQLMTLSNTSTTGNLTVVSSDAQGRVTLPLVSERPLFLIINH